MEVTIRAFEPADYEHLVELGTALDPLYAFTPEVLRHRDQTMDAHIRLLRLVAEVDDEGEGAGREVAGVGRIMHIWWNYHPARYHMRIEVHPRWQQRGIGSQLFDRLMAELGAWRAELVRGEVRADQPHALRFLERRGFREWRRRWESALDVPTANLAALADAVARAERTGIRITTFTAEESRRGTQSLARELYDVETLMSLNVPDVEPDADSMSFERFRAVELDTPDAVADGHFLAVDGDRIVGVSRLMRDLKHSHILRQAFTGVHGDYRGRGIAQALKLRTVEFARSAGYREIRTSNDSTNAPMLHINDALGFRREVPVIIFERRILARASES